MVKVLSHPSQRDFDEDMYFFWLEINDERNAFLPEGRFPTF